MSQNVWEAPDHELSDAECAEMIRAHQRTLRAEHAASSAVAAYQAAYQVHKSHAHKSAVLYMA